VLFLPAGEEHAAELLVEVVLVVNDPHDAVMDDECHKRLFFCSIYMYGKIKNVTAEKIFFRRIIIFFTFALSKCGKNVNGL